MRVVSWNCKGARETAPLWDHFEALEPDVALLQEVRGVPLRIATAYDHRFLRPLTKSGAPQRFLSGVLVRGEIVRPVEIRSGIEWADAELVRYAGNLPAYEVATRSGRRLIVVGVHSPAWPLDSADRYGVDVTPVKLRLNRKLWLSDLLHVALGAMFATRSNPWIVGGDFNLSETFDTLWKGGPRGNREYLDRMAALGLTDALRHSQGALTPTFRSARGGSVLHQIDHLFVTPDLLSDLQRCEVGNQEAVFGGRLSDHLPVVADFGDV